MNEAISIINNVMFCSTCVFVVTGPPILIAIFAKWAFSLANQEPFTIWMIPVYVVLTSVIVMFVCMYLMLVVGSYGTVFDSA